MRELLSLITRKNEIEEELESLERVNDLPESSEVSESGIEGVD
jgi:hypothetical protein